MLVGSPVQSNHCEGTGRRARLSAISLSQNGWSQDKLLRVTRNAVSDGCFREDITANARVKLTIVKLLFITEYLLVHVVSRQGIGAYVGAGIGTDV